MSQFVRLSLAVCFFLLLTACSRQEKTASNASGQPPPEAAGPPVQGDWVVQRINADVDSLNPITGQDTNGQLIRSNLVCEGLLQMDNFTLKLEPCLAERWETSPDQLTYTFHLRHGVKWHDGQPFTAEDVKYTYDKVQDPQTDCAFLRLYFNNIKSCEILDPYTVRFIASQRYFKTLEELGELPIIPKHILEQGEPDFNKHPFARHPIGTGPYKFVRWDTGSDIVLERNDDYWDTSNPRYPKRIIYEVIEEDYIAAQIIKKGEIDVYDEVSPLIWKHSLAPSPAMARLHEIVYPYPAYNYVGYNLRLPLFSDIRVRHALDLLIPRDEIISKVYLGQYAGKTSGYDLPSQPSYNQDVPPTPYDPTLALQLLNQAGWKNDHGDGLLYNNNQPLSFTLLYPAASDRSQKIAELIQESFRRYGIDLKLSELQFAQLIDRTDDWKFDAVLAGWSLDIPNGDPYQIWHGSQADIKKSSNFIGYKNPAADKLMDEARLEYDDDKRNALYRQLHKIIHDDYPVSFLTYPKEIVVISDRYQNVKTFAPRPCFDITSWWVPKPLQKYGD
ncbi:MAG TPA: peptide-binding protein [Candidatus Methylacidiphilales bacterium]|nr:peptide-binding protein [Candidatus Methylacidiphilales bacterium]